MLRMNKKEKKDVQIGMKTVYCACEDHKRPNHLYTKWKIKKKKKNRLDNKESKTGPCIIKAQVYKFNFLIFFCFNF